MKVKDLVPVVINKVQLLYYCVEDDLFSFYKKIGEACYLADMPDEFLEFEVDLVSVSETLSLDIRVFYTDKDNFAEKSEALAQKFAAINEAMTKPGQEPAATETAEPEKEVCTIPAQEEPDIRKLEAENRIMRKALQAIAAYDVHKYIPDNLREILAESPYAAAYGIIQGYAETALEDIGRGLRYS